MIRKAVAGFVDEEVIPRATEVDNQGEYPEEWFREIGRMGIFGLRYPQKSGGSGGNTTLFCIAQEEFGRGLMSLAAAVGMQCLMGTDFLYRFGTKEMIEQYFLPAMRGEQIGIVCFTEPEAGSDLGSVRTLATEDGDGYIINGMKTWITNAPNGDFYTVLCQTDPAKKLKGLDFFFVPRKTPGLAVGKPFEIMGTRTSKISEVYFSDCRIPSEYRFGPKGSGLKNLMGILAEIRTQVAFLGVGLQRAVLADSIRYARERRQFGHPIGDYQLIRAKISNMAVDLEASRLLAYQASRMVDKKKECLKQATMAKYFATEAACRAADQITRIYGGYGFSMEYPAQRYYRDHRFLLYGGGSHEVLLTNIARWEGL